MPPATQRILTATALPDDAGQRLDRFLAKAWPELSRTRLQALLEAGAIERDGVLIAEGSARVKPGQTFALRVREPEPARPQPEDLALDVLYEDEHLLVLEKPAGMVVHPAPGHAAGTLVNALLWHCRGTLSGIGGVLRPGIVHRLDKEVSGLMVVAKGDRAHVGLAGQFSVRRIERGYDAIVWGVPPPPAGSIERPIARHPRDRKRMAVVEGGKRALTHYRLMAAAGTLGARLRGRARDRPHPSDPRASGRDRARPRRRSGLPATAPADDRPGAAGFSAGVRADRPARSSARLRAPDQRRAAALRAGGTGGFRPAVRAALATGARFILW